MPVEPTARDLYPAVRALGERPRDGGRPLEAYLRALWSLARPLAHQPSLPFSALVRMLDEAHTAAPPRFDPAWRALPDEADERAGFAGWEDEVVRQIRDLREMAEAGTLEDGHRYFGVGAPRGGVWYSFDPAGYLEAAVPGSFGGGEPGDGGRTRVPAPVAVMGGDGEIHTEDRAGPEDPAEPLPAIPWETFTELLQNGRSYE